MDRRRSSIWFYLAIIALAYSAYSLAMAYTTSGDCDGYASKTWQVLPPKWECHNPPGFG
jgi:hypothetical protein